MIQSGNWRGARDPARELEGARDAGNLLVQNIENLCSSIKKIAVPVWYRPNLPVPNRNRYQPKMHRDRTGTGIPVGS